MRTDLDYLFKFLFIGDSGVGKSQLLRTFVGESYHPADTTAGVDFIHQVIQIPRQGQEPANAKLQIWDTAGAERFRAIARQFYRGARAAFLVYDITRRASFDSLERWLAELQEYSDPNLVVFIIGNKTDLMNEKIEGEAFATKHQLQFLEVSVEEGERVKGAFVWAAKEVVRRLDVVGPSPNPHYPEVYPVVRRRGCC